MVGNLALIDWADGAGRLRGGMIEKEQEKKMWDQLIFLALIHLQNHTTIIIGPSYKYVMSRLTFLNNSELFLGLI